jgi:hypothetical protein
MKNCKNFYLCLHYFSSYDFTGFIKIPRANTRKITYTKEARELKQPLELHTIEDRNGASEGQNDIKHIKMAEGK